MALFRRDKITATALSKCIAHLVNHQISHEILSLQLLTILLEGEWIAISVEDKQVEILRIKIVDR